MSKKSLEGRVAETMLQENLGIVVGQRTITVPRPTIGTLVMASEYIATLPEFKSGSTAEVLRECIHGEKVARLLAILILGAKRIKFPGIARFLPFKRGLNSMTRFLMLNATSEQLWESFTSILSFSGLDDFFALTTFLRETSITSAREVESSKTKTTAPGQ